MKLFHFSNESSIDVFHPRVKNNRQDMTPVVWAIDEEHQFTFFVPRDCPRIIYTRSNDMLLALNIDIRFTPNLHPLRDAILNSSLTDFGIHQFGNAIPLDVNNRRLLDVNEY